MTTFQKIVKYGALIFAGYLCLMIISGIVVGITAIFGITTGIEMLEENANSEIITTWEQEYSNITEMDIDLSLCKLDIRKGDTLKVNVADVSDKFKCEARAAHITAGAFTSTASTPTRTFWLTWTAVTQITACSRL